MTLTPVTQTDNYRRFERIDRNQNVLVDRLETLGPLARRVSGEHAVNDALPDAHHFGHR